MEERSFLKMHKLLRMIIICCLVSFTQVSISAELDTKTIQKLKWQRGQSQNITVYSDMHPKKVLSLLNLLEDFASYCQIVLSVGDQDRDFTMNFFVAGKSKTWKSLGADPLNVYGWWAKGQSMTALVRTDSKFTGVASGRSSVRMRFYKAVADLQIRKSPHAKSLPFWYLDGMTRYLATYERKGNKVSVGQLNSVLGRLRSMINATKQVEAFDLREVILLESMPRRVDGEGRNAYLDRINELYSLNLMLIHYFYADADRQVQLNTYLALLAQGLGHEEAMLEATGLTLQALGKELFKYLNSRKLYAHTYSLSDVDPLIKENQGDSFKEPKVERVEGKAVIAAYNELIPNVD